MDFEAPQIETRKLIYKELFKDRALIWLIGIGAVLTTFVSLRVLLAISRFDIDIPVRFTQFGGADSYISGDWYIRYEYIPFAIIIFLINSFLALRIYRHHRWVSIGILSMQIVVFIFLIVISSSITSIQPAAA